MQAKVISASDYDERKQLSELTRSRQSVLNDSHCHNVMSLAQPFIVQSPEYQHDHHRPMTSCQHHIGLGISIVSSHTAEGLVVSP